MNIQQKLASLEAATAKRRNKLNSSSEYLQFNWKADLVDSWISKNWYQYIHNIIEIFIVMAWLQRAKRVDYDQMILERILLQCKLYSLNRLA